MSFCKPKDILYKLIFQTIMGCHLKQNDTKLKYLIDNFFDGTACYATSEFCTIKFFNLLVQYFFKY